MHYIQGYLLFTYPGLWSQFSVEHLFKLYVSLNAPPADDIDGIPGKCNTARSRVFGYLICFVGNMKQRELSGL